MWIAKDWEEFEVLDTGDGMKLEMWGDKVLYRPDPQAIWPQKKSQYYDRIDAQYHRSSDGGGSWQYNTKVPDRWQVGYKDLKFHVANMGFKHTGLFPEQAEIGRAHV